MENVGRLLQVEALYFICREHCPDLRPWTQWGVTSAVASGLLDLSYELSHSCYYSQYFEDGFFFGNLFFFPLCGWEDVLSFITTGWGIFMYNQLHVIKAYGLMNFGICLHPGKPSPQSRCRVFLSLSKVSLCLFATHLSLYPYLVGFLSL